MPDEQQHINTDDARAGSTPHIVRYVLVISLTLVILVMALLLLL
ncbi:MAG: hypothetical protein QHC67_16895 [Sphingobium sp.]|nr:hypothetical protein [Sphingobium sp.]MDX3911464.1 hypothetical protein [Sphingobium sp.]